VSVIKFEEVQPLVYVALGIDAHERDQVLAVCNSYESAKRYCIECLVETEFFDLWIEKHPVL
jgi:hypothetical protein